MERGDMKLGRLNDIGVVTPSIVHSIVFYRNVMGACVQSRNIIMTL